MPCGSSLVEQAMLARDGGDSPDTIRRIERLESTVMGVSPQVMPVARAVIAEGERVTRYLCAVLTRLEELGMLQVLAVAEVKANGIETGEIATWWEQHKALDAKRK